ncbi:MAG: hypothetical protein DPW18_20675, partial [Chloroflexi bacterium]|nr:hypothetical protein [Chloroflexota bacterium]
MLGMSIWSFGYSLELFFADLQTKILFSQIEYFGIVTAPLSMLFFALEYTGNSHLLTRRARAALWVIPILTLILVWTNPLHRLMWTDETAVTSSGLTLLSVRFGLFFWIQILFFYGLLLAASSILIMELIHRPGMYRAQISFVILSILVPLVGNLVFLSGVGPIHNLDLTPLFFLPTAIGLFWAIVKYRLLEVLPPEHINVIKTMRDGVIVLNAQQRILYLNPAAEALLGRSDDEAIGQLFPQVSQAFHEKLSPYLVEGEHHAEIQLESGRQTKIYEVTISPVLASRLTQGRKVSDCMVILHDVTRSREAELALARRESIMSAISHAAEQFLRTPVWEGNIPEVLGKLGRAADVSRVLVAVNYTDENKVVHSSLCYEWTAPGIAPQVNNPALQHVPLKAKGFDRWQNTMSDGHLIFGLTKDLPEEEQEFFEPLGSLSIAAIPIFVESHWWGFLMFDECREERKWTGMELDAFHAAASIFGAAESRARAEQQVLRRQRALSLLHEIVGISLQAGDIKEMAQVVVERLGGLIHADGCFITLWDDASKLPIPLASYGMSSDAYTTFKPRQGDLTFTESALRIGRTLVVEDTNTTLYADKSIIQKFAAKSVLVLPLIASEKRMGAVILAFGKKHDFQKEEIAICEQASALIALALEKFKAVEEARQRADTSETLRKVGLAITEKLEMDQAVNHILEQLHRMVPYDSASVQLLEENELVIMGGRGW